MNVYRIMSVVIAVNLLTSLAVIAQDTKKTKTGGGQEMQTNLVESAKGEIQHVMRKHVDSIKAKVRNEPGYSITEKRWERLFSADVMGFATSTALRLADEAIRDGKHHMQSKTFDNIYVAVSVVPSIDDKKSMTLFPEGYFQVLDGLLKESGWLQSNRDFAHWIYCYEGKDKHKVHLTFIPAKSLTSGPNVWIFAQDLMTSEEKSRAGVK